MTRPMAANEAPPEAFARLDLKPPSPRVTASQAVASSSHSPSVQTRFPTFGSGTTFARVRARSALSRAPAPKQAVWSRSCNQLKSAGMN
jgi:hypothetical protein